MERKKNTLIGALPCLLACAMPAFAQDALPGVTPQQAEEVRQLAQSLPPRLLARLQDELQKGGPEGAIAACKDMATKNMNDVSAQTGWRVTRVSLKARNPLIGAPDAWERQALLEFDRRAAAGEAPAKLDRMEVVSEGDARFLRYMKALPTQGLCLTCHGAPAHIPDGVKARLSAAYPHDKATGFSEGQIRGALSIKRPL